MTQQKSRAFVVTPKKNARKKWKQSKKARKAKKNEAAMAQFNDENSPRFSVKSTRKPKAYDDETTVVGTLEL